MSIEQQYLSEDDIGFMLTPRLNAASRMDDPLRAYELLSTENDEDADRLANHLSKINDDRKKIVAAIMKDVNKKFGIREMKAVIVVGNPEWRVGVLGLVAGKLCDLYKKPAFVWGKDENDAIKGSCRSDGSVSVVELMNASSDSFMEFGGHELAGGFTVHPDKIHFLEDALSESYGNIKHAVESKTNDADIAGDFSLCTMTNWRELEKMAPFGLANPKPVFLFENIKIENVRAFGKNGSGEHLEILFSDEGHHKAKAVSFFSNMDSFSTSLETSTPVNVLATFDLSRFRGREELRLRILDIL
ncbi:MAG: DHHA1 domain-containing protein [bacterium]